MNDRAKEQLKSGAAELGLHLDPDAFGKLYAFAAELKKWSRKINLTALKSDEDIAVKHFVDSLSILKVVHGGGSLLDIGSGGGFPAIPLKIVCHHLSIVSVDAVEKKILFQRHSARLLGLPGFDAIHARAEELSGKYAGHFDWVVSRAFSDIPTFIRLALPLLKQGGKIVAMKGKGGQEEADAAGPALLEMGVEVRDIVRFRLPISGDERSLVVIERI